MNWSVARFATVKEAPRVGLEPTGLAPQRTDGTRVTEPAPSPETKYGTKTDAETAPDDPDLRSVVDAWPNLPEAIRAGIVAMVQTCGGGF